MNSVRFFTDEDLHGAVAVQLRAAGFDAVSTPETGRLGESDESQLTWAGQQHRVLVTINVSDFARLHHEWMNQGLHHAGVIISQQRPVGDTVRRLIHLGQTLDTSSMQDRLEYLSHW